MDQINLNSIYSEIREKRIILITFFISIIIHVSAIIAFQGILPRTWFKGNLRAYKINLIRPPIKEIMKSTKKNNSAMSQIHSEPPVETKEATISLDTGDPTYHPYTKVIKEKILNFWIYPLSAQQNFIQGSLLIVFRLDRNGNLIDCNIARSSGHEILDTYALKAVKLAHPFPRFPENITVQFLTINASFAYQLKFE